jgi:hypothetical protein
MALQKAADFKDILQEAVQMKLDVPAVHLIAEPWRLITPTTI